MQETSRLHDVVKFHQTCEQLSG